MSQVHIENGFVDQGRPRVLRKCLMPACKSFVAGTDYCQVCLDAAEEEYQAYLRRIGTQPAHETVDDLPVLAPLGIWKFAAVCAFLALITFILDHK